MKTLFLSAEVAPYVTVGGLSQVMYFLPRSLKKRGFDVRIFTPKYGVTELKKHNGTAPKLQQDYMQMPVPTGKRKESLICNVLRYKPRQKNDATIYFLENREYYELRANVFGYSDDHTRFALLSKGCLEWLLRQHQKKRDGEDVWWPDIIHCHDWHTAYFIEMARKDPRYRNILRKTPVVLSVHNFRFQGNMDFRYLREKEKDRLKKPLASLRSDKLRKQNALKRGMHYADAVSTVSPTHAVEVLTPEYSEGLLDSLLKIRGKLTGILNGLDFQEFNPATDPLIKRRYNSKGFIKARAINKKSLQKEFSLPEDPDATVIGFVGRLAAQKGIDLIIEVIPHLLRERDDVQFIILGAGDEKYRKELSRLKEEFPDKIGLFLFTDFRLPRKLFSGTDLMLMPSVFEPGGIVALEALRYGSVPIVRKTGGLRDTVQHFDSSTGEGNGFHFNKKTAWSLYGVIIEAITIHENTRVWEKLVRNALETRVTWDEAAVEYEDWYKRTVLDRKRYIKRRQRGGLV